MKLNLLYCVIQGMIEARSDAHFQEIISTQSMVLVDFYAGWCEPCKWLDAILNDVAGELEKYVVVLKIDSEALQSVAERFQIRGIPILLLFKNGEVVWRYNGFKSGPELVEVVASFSRGTVQ